MTPELSRQKHRFKAQLLVYDAAFRTKHSRECRLVAHPWRIHASKRAAGWKTDV
jgi:hypothetical protein